MKSIFFTMLLALILLFSILASVTGLGMIVVDIYNGSHNLMKGFQVFSLGMILFFVTTIAYIATKILSSTEVLVEAMTTFIEHEIDKTNINPLNDKSNTNPLQSLFGNLSNLSNMGFSGTNMIIKMGAVDEDGNITPLDETKFDSKDDFLKYRDEIIAKAFGQKSDDVKKKFEDMTIDELKKEEQKAVAKQNFELAAAIVNIIEEKKKNS